VRKGYVEKGNRYWPGRSKREFRKGQVIYSRSTPEQREIRKTETKGKLTHPKTSEKGKGNRLESIERAKGARK